MKKSIILSLILLFVAYSCVSASISLIVVSPQNDTASVKYQGLNVRPIKESDLALFKLSMIKLKQALTNYFDAEPDHIYLAENVPLGDIHQNYCWEPVSIVATTLNATVKNVTSEPTILFTHDFDNNSNQTIKVQTDLKQTIENSIRTSWSVNKEIAIQMEIKYDVNFIFGKSSGYAGFSTTLDWGESEERIQTETVGASTSVEMELEPGQKATAELVAQKGVIEVEVEYMATLRGILGVSFIEPHKGHNYWGVPIDQLFIENQINNYVQTVGAINLGYYTAVKTKVHDRT